MAQIDVSLIIVNYHTKGLVRECIKSFQAHTSGLEVEYIVVDVERDPGLQTLLRERFKHVSYIALRRNLGFSAGVNTGISIAQGTYYFILNADITAVPGVLERLYHYMEAHHDVGIAGPQLLNPDRTIQQSYYRFHTPLTPIFRRLSLGRWQLGRTHLDSFLMKDMDPARISRVDWLLGAALFARRTAVERVGLMDSERFFLYFEDTDWCRRFWSHGYQVHYVPHAQLIHLYKRDSAKQRGLRGMLDPITRIHITSGIRYFLKYWKK